MCFGLPICAIMSYENNADEGCKRLVRIIEKFFIQLHYSHERR